MVGTTVQASLLLRPRERGLSSRISRADQADARVVAQRVEGIMSFVPRQCYHWNTSTGNLQSIFLPFSGSSYQTGTWLLSRKALTLADHPLRIIHDG